MSEWKYVTCCPHCGGELIISDHYAFTRDYRITKRGVLSKRSKRSSDGSMDCTTGYCLSCNTGFDEDEIAVEADGTVWVREKGCD